MQKIKKKHWQDVRKLVRWCESLMTKYMKFTADIKFIKLCKVEKIVPTFAKVNLSIKSGSRKLKLTIARLVMESEIQSKHLEKKKLKKELRLACIQLKSALALFLYNALLHQVSFAVKNRQKAILKRHQKKLIRFRKSQNIAPKSHKPIYLMVWALIFPQILTVTQMQQNSNSFSKTYWEIFQIFSNVN